MQELFGTWDTQSVFKPQYGLLHAIFILAGISLRNCAQCLFCCNETADELKTKLNNGSDLREHIPSDDYLKEIPIRHTRQYYQRILSQLALAKSQ